MKITFHICFFVWLCPLFCVGQNNAVVKVKINPVFKGAELQLGKTYALNEKADSFQVTMLKFYVSNVKFINDNAVAQEEKESCHLMDAEEEERLAFSCKQIKTDKYIGIQFGIGVDSAKNNAGILSGDLDPANGMFWAWNTGYVSLKIEGNYIAKNSNKTAVDFHIGGYLSPYNTYRTVDLKFPQSRNISKKAEVVIEADVIKLFSGINLSETFHVVIPGKEAMILADNYSKMFKIISVESE
ncbi:MAG: hypothetical protein IPM51_14990 [Sphingobacteriaceae bacterium]|nr:hypothetical protein [Sphingobacteriaceae bacterium]